MKRARSGIVATACVLALACALCGSGAASAAPVSVERSGWLWSNPTPQGETLNDASFAGGRGFAVGEAGTVLRSDDGGASWVGLASETQSNLTHVQALDASTLLVGGACTLRESTDAGASFRRLAVTESEGRCPNAIASFSFLDANTGFVELAGGQILSTKDGGSTLEAKASVQGPAVGGIDFLSPSTGFAITYDPDGGGGHILRTTDGAASWTSVASTPARLSQITFVTPAIAYAVGANSTLLRSSDGGASWQAQPLALTAGTPVLPLTGIACADAMHCVLTSDTGSFDGALLVRTADGGASGTVVHPEEEAGLYSTYISAVAFASPTGVVAVGRYGGTFLSGDAGASFHTQGYAHLQNVPNDRRVRLGESSLDAYMSLEGGQDIAATTDGGLTWSALHVPTSSGIVDVAFPSTRIGYAVSTNGTVFKSTTAGLTWSILGAPTASPSAILAPNPSTVVVLGAAGVERSSDGGASFVRENPMVVLGRSHGRMRAARLSRFDLSNGAELAAGAIFAFGNELVDPSEPLHNSVLESTDDGAHWIRLPSPVRRQVIEAISFVSPTSGYESTDGRLFFTRNRGRSWRKILSLGSNTELIYPPVNLSFSSAEDGYVMVNYERRNYEPTLLRTQNGGRSWTPEPLPGVTSQVTAGGAVDYAVGEEGDAIFKTTDGGLAANRSTLTLTVAPARRSGRARSRRGGRTVNLRGRLRPAVAGAEVTISYLVGHHFFWHHAVARVDASGAFALSVRGVDVTSEFVAQWSGNERLAGAGTPVLRVVVPAR